MKTIWQECPRGDVVPHWSSMYVTMNPKGHITMSRVTYERVGAPAAFLVLFDEVNNRIGLKQAHVSRKNAYPVSPSGRHGGKLLRAFRLMSKFGIVLTDTVQFHDADLNEEGILVLDLRSAKVSPRSVAKRKSLGKKGN